MNEKKIVVALVVLGGLLAGVYVSKKNKAADAAAHSASGDASLPKVALSKDDAKKVDKLVIKNRDKGEVTLEKKGKSWRVTKPVDAAANKANVDAAIKNLQDLNLAAVIAQTPAKNTLKRYELEAGKALTVKAFAGGKSVFDMVFGKSGGRGQIVQLAGKPAVYAAKDFKSFNFAREIKNWRNTDVVSFEDGNVIGVEVDNSHGKMSFTKDGDSWSAALYKRSDTGLAKKASKWEDFDPAKVKDMLNAFKKLKATDFGTKDADTGLVDAVKSGGVVRINMKDGAASHVLAVGKAQKGNNRYLSYAGDKEKNVYVVGSWVAEWAFKDPSKWSKPEEKKEDAGKGTKAKK
jgi:hypothetical protein